LGIGDWGLGIGDLAQSPIPNPQSPIPNYFCYINKFNNIMLAFKILFYILTNKIWLKIKLYYINIIILNFF